MANSNNVVVESERKKPTRVILVDDHAFVRTGVRAVLSKESDILVVAEAGSGEEAVELALELKPDLVVMDINMPGISGIEATRRIKAREPEMAVVVLTVSDSQELLTEAIQAGAGSYLLKNSSSAHLVRSIRATAHGTSLVPLHLLRQALKSEESAPPEVAEPDTAIEPLTPREMDVLVRIVGGLRNQQIAEELGVATVTVKKRVRRIITKLRVGDRIQAALKAVKLNLVEL